MSYDCRKLNWFAETEIWAVCTFRHKSGFWWNFAMTSWETLNPKIAVNKLRFPLVTYTVYSDTWFDSYRILKLGQRAEYFLNRLDMQMDDQVLQA
jgi:hypothetical protein